MTLPELVSQFVYGRLAWAVVLAAVVVALFPRAWSGRRAPVAAALGGACLLAALPGEASPAYWLGLALQYPSGLLACLGLAFLHARWRGAAPGPFMALPLAAVLAIAGTALYLDAIGYLSLGLYYAGFGPAAAPVLALACVAACAALLARGQGGRQNVALLCAFLLFSLLRLPTGNLWDAVLDPLLWAWALAALARHGLRRLGAGKRQRASGAVPITSFSVSKEQVRGK